MFLISFIRLILHRHYSSTIEISQHPFDVCVAPKTPNLWLSRIGDIGTLLLSDISISQLQEIALVRYLSTQCIAFAVSLTKEILRRIQSSTTAISYFVRGLLLPHISGFFPSPSLLLQYQEMKIETVKSSSSKFVKDQLAPLLGLDQLIISLLDPTKFDQESTHPNIISQLIDTLKLSIIPFLSFLRSSSSPLPPLQSPLHSISLCVHLLNKSLKMKDSRHRNESFWMALSSINELFQAIKPLDLTVDSSSDSAVVSHLHTLLEYLSRILIGIGKMKVDQIQKFEKSETKFLFSQIRSINFSSPMVIPNASTNTGDYTIGIWIKIPVSYYHQISQYEHTSNVETESSVTGNLSREHSLNIPSNALKIHLLSRVPEAGEIDMTSLFLVNFDLYLVFLHHFILRRIVQLHHVHLVSFYSHFQIILLD